jgi:hypothetical protein
VSDDLSSDRRAVSTGAVLATLVACHIVFTLQTGSPRDLLSAPALGFTAFRFCGPFAGWVWAGHPLLAPLVALALVAVYLWLLWTTRLGRVWAIVHVLVLLAWSWLGLWFGAYGGAMARAYWG